MHFGIILAKVALNMVREVNAAIVDSVGSKAAIKARLRTTCAMHDVAS